MDYWIEGGFDLWWTKKSFYDSTRDIFIPKWAILNLDSENSPGMIYGIVKIKSKFAIEQVRKLKELKKSREFSWQNKQHYYLHCFCSALNKPYIQEKVELEEDWGFHPPTALP